MRKGKLEARQMKKRRPAKTICATRCRGLPHPKDLMSATNIHHLTAWMIFSQNSEETSCKSGIGRKVKRNHKIPCHWRCTLPCQERTRWMWTEDISTHVDGFSRSVSWPPEPFTSRSTTFIASIKKIYVAKTGFDATLLGEAALTKRRPLPQ
ncbi:hypothetical protein VTG60DRAFT_1377 [Thermothelomyces hinnuleus]